MKKFKFFAMALLVAAIGLGFTSCSNDDDEKDAGLTEVINVENATLRTGSMPAVTDTQTQVVASSNSSALAGGANIVTVTSPVELKKFFVGVEGMDGYYEITPEAARSTRADAPYTYVLTLNYGTELAQDLTLVITAQTIDDLVVAVAKTVVEYVESKEGSLNVNLVFDQDKDVDLHLFLPEGAPIEWVYYYTKGIYTGTQEEYAALQAQAEKIWNDLLKKYGYSENTDEDEIDNDSFWAEYNQKMEAIQDAYDKKYSGLDHDSNAGCRIDGLKNENIVINADVLVPGTYKVYVNLWENCQYTEEPTKWTCITRFLNKEVTAIEGKNPAYGEFAGNANGNDDDYVEYMTLATTFTLTQAEIDRAKASTRAGINTKTWEVPASMKAIMKAMESGRWDNVKRHRYFK